MEHWEQVFLTALGAALRGQKAPEAELTGERWQSLARLAQAHKVLPLIFQSLSTQSGAMEALAPCRPAVRSAVMLQTRKTHDFLALAEGLRAAGIRALVVKGIVCRSLYPQPDLRPSSDEDLLVPPEQYEAAQKVLEEYGMTCTKIRSGDHERDYGMEGSPLFVELHRDLFSPEEPACSGWNRYFDSVFDRAEEQEIQGTPVLTMGPTDHMLYLLLHAFKHFIHSGVGIRQLCDICLYAQARSGEISWPRILEISRELRAEGFVRGVFALGRQYLNLNPAGCPEDGPDPEALLADILGAGIYGSATQARLHSGNMTLKAVTDGPGGRGPALLGALFPDSRKLEDRYPYLKKRPWLVPVAWGDRLVRYVLKTPDAGEAAAEGNRRVALLRQYGVLGEE